MKERIWKDCKSDSAAVDGYVPVPTALAAHKADCRGIAFSGGWRAGKSLASGMEGVAWLPFASLIWLVAVDYDTTRQEFIYLSEAAVSSGLAQSNDVRISTNKYQPCAMTSSVTGCKVETRTLADYRKLAAQPPDLIIVCEPGLIDNLNEVMELMMGRVSQKRGMIWLAGTSDESSEEWYQHWERWDNDNIEGGVSFSLPTWENLVSFPGGINERDFQVYRERYGEEAFMAHYGGKPASPRNLVLKNYWSRELNVDNTIKFTPEHPVEIAIDPNYSLGNKYTVEVIQWDVMSGQEWVVDEVAEEGFTHEQIIEVCRGREWWPYVTAGTIDPYAGESHIYGSHAPVWYWEPHVDLRLDHRPRVRTTVQALKSAFIGDQLPPMLVSDRCERLIWEAPRWRQTKTGEPQKHTCDAMKALGYWLVDRRASMQLQAAYADTNEMEVSDWRVDARGTSQDNL